MELLLRYPQASAVVLCTFRAPVLQRFYVHHGMVLHLCGSFTKAFGCIEFLFASGEYKFSAAIFADESFVFVHVIYLALD